MSCSFITHHLCGNFGFKLIENFVTLMEEADVVDEIPSQLPFSQTGEVALARHLFKKIIVFGYFKFHVKQDAVNAILENND